MNLRVIAANIVVSIKSFYREKPAVFFRLAFPVILILVFGTIFMDRDDVSYDLRVQDLDQTKASARLIQAIKLSRHFNLSVIAPDVDAAEYVKDNKTNLVVRIPEGFQGSLMRRAVPGNPDAFATVEIVYDPSSNAVSSKLQALDAMLAAINQEMSGRPPLIRSTATSILAKKYRFIEFFVPGIIAMTVMSASLFGAVNVNAELRQKGVLRKLSTTPITRSDWILSNILYQFILAALATVVILLVSYAVFHVSLRINVWLAVFVVLDVFAFVGLGMMLTRVAKDAESSAAAANALMFPMMFLSGTFFPVEMMPGFLQKVARLLPLYYVNEGLRAAMVSGDNMAAMKYAAVIAVFAAAVFVLGMMATTLSEEEA